MTIWTFLAFNACAVMWSALLLWAYYCGSKAISPIPQISNPIAGIWRRARGNGEISAGDTVGVPESVRRA